MEVLLLDSVIYPHLYSGIVDVELLPSYCQVHLNVGTVGTSLM